MGNPGDNLEAKRKAKAKRAKEEIDILKSYIESSLRSSKIEQQTNVVAKLLEEVTDLTARLVNVDEENPEFDSFIEEVTKLIEFAREFVAKKRAGVTFLPEDEEKSSVCGELRDQSSKPVEQNTLIDLQQMENDESTVAKGGELEQTLILEQELATKVKSSVFNEQPSTSALALHRSDSAPTLSVKSQSKRSGLRSRASTVQRLEMIELQKQLAISESKQRERAEQERERAEQEREREREKEREREQKEREREQRERERVQREHERLQRQREIEEKAREERKRIELKARIQALEAKSEKTISRAGTVVSIDESNSYEKTKKWLEKHPTERSLLEHEIVEVNEPSNSSNSERPADQFGTPMLQPRDFVSRAKPASIPPATNRQYPDRATTALFPSRTDVYPSTTQVLSSSVIQSVYTSCSTTTIASSRASASRPIYSHAQTPSSSFVPQRWPNSSFAPVSSAHRPIMSQLPSNLPSISINEQILPSIPEGGAFAVPKIEPASAPNALADEQFKMYHSPIHNQLAPFDRTCLPKLNLEKFDGDPVEWPEWSGMFTSTIIRAPLAKVEKMAHLKTLLSGKAKAAVESFGYDGSMFDNAWRTLEEKFGEPDAIVDAYSQKIQAFMPIKMHSSEQIISFAQLVTSFVGVLKSLGFTHDLYGAAHLKLIISKLPPNLREKWFSFSCERERANKTLESFSEWLQKTAKTHEHVLRYQESVKPPVKSTSKIEKTKSNTVISKQTQSSPSSCPFCEQNHRLWKCDKFIQKTATERAEFARDNRICFSCLDGKHNARQCTKKLKCTEQNCKSTHNTLLHGADRVSRPRTEAAPSSAPSSLVPTSSASTVLTCNSGGSLPKAILQVAKIQVVGANGPVDTYALCDSGSMQSWISPKLSKQLNLPGEKITLEIHSFTGSEKLTTEKIDVRVQLPEQNGEFIVEALVKPDFAIGTEQLDLAALKTRYPHLKPVCEDVLDYSSIDILLGQTAFEIIRPIEYCYNKPSEPWAVKLPLGWVISGPLPNHLRKGVIKTSSFFIKQTSDRDLTEELRKWWDVETYATNRSVDPRSAEDKRALAKLEESTYHNGERYVVGMLWKDGKPNLPNNYTSALANLLSLEKRLAKDEQFQQKYNETVETDIKKGYIRRVPPEELEATENEVQWYLPHHGVVNEHKPEKVRRVCNAAAKYRGVSLNDALMKGPDLYNSLVGILMRFRVHPVVLTADVEAMFLQVGVPENDQRTLRFLWRGSPSEKVQVYQYLCRIFGGCDSPTCAQFALRRTASDNAEELAEAASTVQREMYMDDLHKSVTDSDRAKKLYRELVELCRRGGFNLTKWYSNNTEVMQAFREDGVVLAKVDPDEPILTILGLDWKICDDTLTVTRGTSVTNYENPSQRQILSTVSKVFDPLGLIAPFMVRSRILLREVWQSMGQQWDLPVGSDEAKKFRAWIEDLPEARKIEMTRRYFEFEPRRCELHAFADASLEAMCAVVYLRSISAVETVNISFIIGKARVAPIRSHTVPKLELQAALVAARLTKQVSDELDLKIDRVIYWTDSTTVLQWLANAAKKQPVFVANRVTEILETSTIDEWRYVPTDQNPADCGTRGLSPDEIVRSDWLNGPAFLLEHEDSWPSSPIVREEAMLAKVTFTEHLIEWERVGKFNKLVNIIAYCRRILPDNRVKKPYITADEHEQAQVTIWKLCQRETFGEDIQSLASVKSLAPKSAITALLPFIDEDGLLRARGRTQKSNLLPYSTKNPIILDASHPAVKLFLIHRHESDYHAGVEYSRASIQQNFWIIRLRSALRNIRRNCLRCKRVKASTLAPVMADLPAERVSDQLIPFAQVGCDFFGPFRVKYCRKVLKRYCCLFTCLKSRAIHIEVCHSLDTSSCIAAIQRFSARRGKPHSILSDNGTNFVGAVKELRECVTNWNAQVIEQSLAQENIRWRFNPPSSPHFGGIWERMVRSCKQAAYDILGSRAVTDETLSTTMCLVEHTLNARPITPARADASDLEALTPSHFTLGRPSACLPLRWTAPSDICLRKAYKHAEAYSDMIWNRWLTEYLPSLNARSKWLKNEHRRLAIGDLVWLADPPQPRSVYPLARVLELHRAADGNVRAATIQTKTGIYTRPVVKLIPLEVQQYEQKGVPEMKSGNRAGNVADPQLAFEKRAQIASNI